MKTRSSKKLNLIARLSFLGQLKVGPRVSLGYGMALGIAFIGTMTGIAIGEHYERQSRDVLDQATAQSQLLLEATERIYDASIHQRELAYFVDNPETLAESIAAFREKAEAFHQAFTAFQAGYYDAELTPAEADLYSQLMDEYRGFARPYFRRAQLQLLQVEALDLASADSPDRALAQTLLLEAGSEPSLMSARRFIRSLQALSDLLEANRVAATDALKTTAVLRRNIIGASLLMSLVIASALAYTISRSIVRPLKLVEQVAQAVTESDRFDLQAPVTTHDEVATLAIALNQLIVRVRSLLEEEAKRTQAMEAANQELASTQTQMIAQEKLASLGSLTAGIAHEIKNPLNFVNNFSELSVELVDELVEILAAEQFQTDSEVVEEMTDIVEMLKANVSKIEHHGKRADKIVGNMLMHSRRGKTEWSQINLNELVAEAVNLAYHGMRSKQSVFNLTFDSDYDPTLELIDGCAQDLNRVFLNIANNACYAIFQRQRVETAEFKPLLKVRTRDRKDHVEITLRDNGIGMPPEVKNKIFEQFFTTKPTGEGTGLGLSLSYDIITQQHKGTIQVDSVVGLYTDFVITLPKQSVVPSA